MSSLSIGSGTSQQSGNICGAEAEIFAEAGKTLLGARMIESGSAINCNWMGMAAEFVASAQLVLRRFQERHSQELPLMWREPVVSYVVLLSTI